jgi:hypothetical protein
LPEFDLFGKHSVERSSKTRSRAVPNTPLVCAASFILISSILIFV